MKRFLIFLTNQSKRKTSIDIKVTTKPKPTKNNTRPYLNEIPTHFIHEIKTKGYDVIGVNLFLRTLMRFLRKKGDNFIPPILLALRDETKRLCGGSIFYALEPIIVSSRKVPPHKEAQKALRYKTKSCCIKVHE